MIRLILILTLLSAVGAGPATKPTSAPVRVRDGLVNGSVRYMVPTAWDVTDRTKNGFEAFYSLPDGNGRVSIQVTQQVQAIPQNDMAVKKQLIEAVVGGITKDLIARKVKILDAPKLERDDRFMLKVHERFVDGEATLDAVHFYRAIGLNMIGVLAFTKSQDPEEIKAIHEAGALMLLSVTLGPPDKKIPRPVTLE